MKFLICSVRDVFGNLLCSYGQYGTLCTSQRTGPSSLGQRCCLFSFFLCVLRHKRKRITSPKRMIEHILQSFFRVPLPLGMCFSSSTAWPQHLYSQTPKGLTAWPNNTESGRQKHTRPVVHPIRLRNRFCEASCQRHRNSRFSPAACLR